MKTNHFISGQLFLLCIILILSLEPFCLEKVLAQDLRLTYHVMQNNPTASDAFDIPGTIESPYLSIGRAVQNIKPGDSVIIHEGIYRESAEIKVSGTPEQPITILAADNEKVIMRGSSIVSSWVRQTGTIPIFTYTGWTKYFGTWSSNVSDARDLARNQLYVNGEYVQEVRMQADLRSGTFCIGKAAKTIYLWLKNDVDPNTRVIEVSDRDYCLSIRSNYINVKGIHIEYGANGPQGDAMFRVIGNHNTIEDCTVEWAAGSGFSLNGDYNNVKRCIFNHNGQIGFGTARSDYCLFEDCETSYNNLHPGKEYSPDWEAGGLKVALSKSFNFLRHVAIGNNGPGIWYDISNDSCEVKNCFTKGNYGSGLFYEISYRLYATDNVMIGNGLDPASWGANGGISLSCSPGCIIERNILLNNSDGFQFREQERTTPQILGPQIFGAEIPVWNHDQIIQHNILAFNRKSQARGWFDVEDGRHWPEGLRSSLPADERISSANAEWAAVYQDTTSEAKDVTLEMLNIKIDSNLYWTANSNQAIFQWGTEWNYYVKYNNLLNLSTSLDFEGNGIIADPGFNNWQNLDLRVDENNSLLNSRYYPLGDVPLVKLGKMSPVGVIPLKNNSQKLKIFPNPVKGRMLNLDLSGYFINENLVVNISDISGRRIYSSELQTGDTENTLAGLDLGSYFIPGIYIVCVKSKCAIINERIIIE